MTCNQIKPDRPFMLAAMGCFSLLPVFAGAAVLAVGDGHTVVVKNDGTVLTWGGNSLGQLGNGTTVNTNTPVQASGLTGMTAVAAGPSQTIALKSDGTVWAWGYNGLGQLGNGSSTNSSTAVKVSGLTGVTEIAAGQYHMMALKSDGTVWAWGANNWGQLGNVTASTCTSAAGSSYDCSTIPLQITALSGISAIAAGADHTLALKSDGTVWAWGANVNGQLGNGKITFGSVSPAQVTGLTGISAIATGAGMSHNLALKSDGTVWAWGYNGLGQIGNSTTTDVFTAAQLTALTGISAITGGKTQSIALKSNATLWAWGLNSTGELGTGNTTQSTAPIQIGALSGVTGVAAGGHGIAQKSDGTVWTWGANSNGQLGNGVATNSSTPVQVLGLLGLGVLNLADPYVFSANSSNYTITKTSTGYTVKDNVGSGGTIGFDASTKRLKFSNTSIALDLDGVAGQAYRLYQAAFNRLPDLGGLGYQMAAMEVSGLSLDQVSQNFINSPEFSNTYGNLTDTQFITLLYKNVLQRVPDSGGLAFYVNGLAAKTFTKSRILMGFSESDENKALVLTAVQNGIEYTPLAP